MDYAKARATAEELEPLTAEQLAALPLEALARHHPQVQQQALAARLAKAARLRQEARLLLAPLLAHQ